MLYKYLDRSHTLFEFRSGGVTHQAAKRGLKIYSVEIGKSWLYLLKKEIKNMNNHLKNDVNITYLLTDLHSNNRTYEEFIRYVKIYNHSKYQADLIYIDGEYHLSCLMNIYNQIDENVIIIIHELDQMNFLKTIKQYYNVIEFSVRLYVLKKKNKNIVLSDSSIDDLEQKDFSKKNIKTWFFDFIKSNYNDIIEKYKYYYNDNMIKPVKNQIWFFWWQKIEEAPEVVKISLASIVKNFNGEVNVITKENYLNYISIPSYILEKVNRKNISLTHFADVYRMKLLAERGGLWVDATILVTKTIPLDIFNYPYFSIRFDHDFKFIYGKWCTFLQGSYINNIVTKFVSDILIAHMKKYDTFMHYYFLDFIILFGYDYLPQFHNDVQLIPFNNLDVLNIFSHITKEYSNESILPFIKDTYFIKMNWRFHFKSIINGNLTIYGYYAQKYLNKSVL